MSLHVFKYHYNKPESRRLRKPKMSVHFNKKCHVVDHIQCNVPARTHHMKRQPYCVMKGKCWNVRVDTDSETGLTCAFII